MKSNIKLRLPHQLRIRVLFRRKQQVFQADSTDSGIWNTLNFAYLLIAPVFYVFRPLFCQMGWSDPFGTSKKNALTKKSWPRERRKSRSDRFPKPRPKTLTSPFRLSIYLWNIHPKKERRRGNNLRGPETISQLIPRESGRGRLLGPEVERFHRLVARFTFLPTEIR